MKCINSIVKQRDIHVLENGNNNLKMIKSRAYCFQLPHATKIQKLVQVLECSVSCQLFWRTHFKSKVNNENQKYNKSLIKTERMNEQRGETVHLTDQSQTKIYKMTFAAGEVSDKPAHLWCPIQTSCFLLRSAFYPHYTNPASEFWAHFSRT